MFRRLFSRASHTLRDATQVVTFLSVTKKNCVGGPIADQSQSAVGARGYPELCHLKMCACYLTAVLQLTDSARLAHPWRRDHIPLGILVFFT